MTKRTWVTLLVGTAVVFIVYRIFGGGNMMMGAMPDAMPVSAAPAIEKRITEWAEFSGRLRAVEDVEIRPRVSGTIESVHFKEGDFVEKGARLFTIDIRPYQAAYDQVKARSDLLSLEAGRASQLYAEKAISKQEYDQKAAAAKEARAALQNAQLSLEYADIRAPISGQTGRAEITVGNMVDAGPGAPVLTTMQSVSPVYADFEIDEQTYLRLIQPIRADQSAIAAIPVELALANETDFTRKGRILSFDNQLSPASGTLRVRAEFTNDDRALTPGLFARIRMGGAQQVNAVLINEHAIGTDQSKKFVYVVKDDGSSEYREVKLGGRSDNLRIVKEGLKSDETIVVNGLMRVRPGVKLLPQPVDMGTLQPLNAATPAAGTETPTEAPPVPEKP